MNLFIGYPGESHPIKCEGCRKNIFLKDAHQYGGTHWCMDCHSKGRHLRGGPGFGPMRFSGEHDKHRHATDHIY